MIENLLLKLGEAEAVRLYDDDDCEISSLSIDEIDAIRLALAKMWAAGTKAKVSA